MIALVVSFSTPAFADYFACELTNGFNKVEVEAEYRVLEASVVQRPFACEGKVEGGLVVTKITSTETGEFAVASDRGSATVELTALDIHGDGQDTGVCACGLR